MKKISFIIISSLIYFNAVSQEASTLVKWYSIQDVQKENKKKPRKIFVDVYTDWCHWCKVMDKNTFSHTDISKYMNENYYCVKFNAESKDEFSFNNKSYINANPNAMRAAHQFAYFLTKGRLSYPTVVILGENLEVIQAIPGYQKPSQMEAILNYYASDAYKTKDWDTFKSTFKGKIKDE